MSNEKESKYTSVGHAEAVFSKAKGKIDGKVLTIPKGGMGLRGLSAYDYLQNICNYIGKTERQCSFRP